MQISLWMEKPYSMCTNYEDKLKHTFCEKGRHVWIVCTCATFYTREWRPRPLKVCSKPDSHTCCLVYGDVAIRRGNCAHIKKMWKGNRKNAEPKNTSFSYKSKMWVSINNVKGVIKTKKIRNNQTVLYFFKT